MIQRNWLSTKTLASGVLFTVLFTGCTDSAHLHDWVKKDMGEGLFTTRSEVEDPFVTILRLKNPALLETATRENGKLTIDPALLAKIEEEQEATIEELKSISSEIRILLRYKSVLNGLAIWAPAEVYEKIRSLPNVSMTERAGRFKRAPMAEEKTFIAVGPKTSVKFIGSEAAYLQGFRGQGMKVGIIDTGIDYTHKMLGGEGTEEAYKAVNPAEPTPAFPNKKVVGGIDLVGSAFNTSSADPKNRIPVPDANPLDEAGHGTHVAGTVAGLGDGVKTYDGVAPEALLYAIKVFGANGSTSDEVVIGALEYAVNPSGDLKYEDQLDVVNLSLGGGYGNPHIMYAAAIKNTVRGGTVVVASAGNSGDQPYIVGAPSISDEAISVASSIDNMNQNVLFPAAEFKLPGKVLTSEVVEGAITKPLSEITSLEGELVDIGLAQQELSEEIKARLAGKVAFVERGVVSFAEKITRAQVAGAIAVVVMNNVDDPPFIMGGDGTLPIPGVMISKKEGEDIRAALAAGHAVIANLKPAQLIEKPWLVDTISDFSSRGPRSEDGMIKPEITAPGTNIISADIGGGDKGVALSGTSMAGPHIAGVMALLKQKYTALTPLELKSVLLGHGKIIHDKDKNDYSVSRQGAGRVQVAESLKAQVISTPATLSFGITDLETQKALTLPLKLKNISDKELSLAATWKGSAALKLSVPAVLLAPGEEKEVLVKATLNAASLKEAVEELDGFLQIKAGEDLALQIPALSIVRKISQVKGTSLVVQATSEADSAGSAAELTLENTGINEGPVYLFNLLGVDNRKPNNRPDYFPNRNCDMQSAGYRIIEKDGSRILQIAVKLYEGMTTWHACEVNVQIDSNNDNKTDQEIAGLPASSLPGLTTDNFISLLLDGNKAREIRKVYEQKVKADPKVKENYTEAIQDMRDMVLFDNSTLAIIEANINNLMLSEGGELSLKISTTHQDAGINEYDDFLEKQATQWKKISVHAMAQGYAQIPEELTLQAQEKKVVPLLKGYGAESLIIYAPMNRGVRYILLEDSQSQIISPVFKIIED